MHTRVSIRDKYLISYHLAVIFSWSIGFFIGAGIYVLASRFCDVSHSWGGFSTPSLCGLLFSAAVPVIFFSVLLWYKRDALILVIICLKALTQGFCVTLLLCASYFCEESVPVTFMLAQNCCCMLMLVASFSINTVRSYYRQHFIVFISLSSIIICLIDYFWIII